MSRGTSKRVWSQVGPRAHSAPARQPAASAATMAMGAGQPPTWLAATAVATAAITIWPSAPRFSAPAPNAMARPTPTMTMGTARARVALRLLGVPIAPRMQLSVGFDG